MGRFFQKREYLSRVLENKEVLPYSDFSYEDILIVMHLKHIRKET